VTSYRTRSGRRLGFPGPDTRAWAAGVFTLAPEATAHLHAAESGLVTTDAPNLVPASAFHLHVVEEGLLTIDPVTLVSADAFHSHAAQESAFGVAGGPVSAVEIEANGWVLAVTGTWAASARGDFPLTADNVLRITGSTTSAGFDRVSGNQASANAARARPTIYGTEILRRPWPNDSQIDEEDLGGGLRKVRIALSDWIWPGDPVTVSFAAGWRSGLAAQSGVAATNNGAKAKQIPIVRWVTPTNMRRTGAFDLELLVAAHEPDGLSSAAAVKFIGYDGTNTFEAWATYGASTQHADGLRCWRATVNPTTLTAGLTTWHWEVYPWIGAVRRSGTTHATSELAGYSTAAARPVMVAWDPAGTRYAPGHIFVDPATGTTTPASVTVGATLAAAKAGTRAASVSVAMQAGYLLNRTLAAANGFASKTRSLDGLIITLAVGTHTSGAQAVTAGATADETRVIVRGDPDDSNPRANCIWNATDTPVMRGNLWQFDTLTTGMGGATFLGSNTGRRITFLNVTMVGRAGQEAATNSFSASSPATGEWGFEAFNCSWTRYGASPGGAATRKFGTIRNFDFARGCEALCLVNARRVADATVADGGRGQVGGIAVSVMSGDQTGAEDNIMWNISAIVHDGSTGITMPSGVSTAIPSNPTTVRRLALVNVLIEKPIQGAPTGSFVDAAGDLVHEDVLWDGCTIVGQRVNWGYDQPSDGTTPMPKTGTRQRNVYADRMACKGDQEAPQNSRTANWSEMYSVGHEGSCFMNRVTTAGFEREYFGIRSTRDPDTAPGGTPGPGPSNNDNWPAFTADRSQFTGTGDPKDGVGDYRPAVGSPLLTFNGNPRCVRSTCDTYRDGTLKSGAGFAAGSEVPA
jgi:hypothetical protein